MASLNKVTLIGNLGRDPELRYTKSQTPFVKFSMATTERFTTNGEQREKTEWHNIVIWGKQAEIAGRYLKKGRQIYLEGRIEYREFEGQDGQKKYITEIKADRFLMLGPRDNQGGGGYGGGQGGYGAPGGYGGSGGGYDAPQQGGYGGPQTFGPPPDAGNDHPMSYGDGSGGDIPESDDFNDDDIPF